MYMYNMYRIVDSGVDSGSDIDDNNNEHLMWRNDSGIQFGVVVFTAASL